jgi:hypothetical protein
MISRAKGFLQARSAVPADFQHTVGELASLFVFVLHFFGAISRPTVPG